MNPKNALADETLDSLIAQVADEYVERLDRGEKPNSEEFARRYPNLAEVLPPVLAALKAMRSLSHPVNPLNNAIDLPAKVGEILGDYRLLREVGRGGMGIVFEAEQVSLGRRVALKVLPYTGSLDAKQLQRFKNEAQAAAQLHHPNIVPVFAVGCEQGVHYYAMQYIDGQTVAARIDNLRETTDPTESASSVRALEVPFPADSRTLSASGNSTFFREVSVLGLQAARALEHAHQLGVVHRDIKPANLLVDLRGNLWITDFGLARFPRNVGLTLPGDLVGTLRYMSPEQALGRSSQVDPRTDLYSLGATLYEWLTLQPVLQGSDRHELLRQIADDEPRSLRSVNRDIPVDLETIVLKALAKNLAERYGTAREMADDLQRFLEDRPVLARRPTVIQRTTKWARRHKSVVGAVVGLVLLTLTSSVVGGFLVWHELQRAELAFQAEAVERARADQNLTLALEALNETCLKFAENRLPRGAQREDQKLLAKALEFYEQIAKNNQGNPSLYHEVGKAYLRVGMIQARLGQYQDAEQSYQKSEVYLAALTRDYPGEAEFSLELARVYHHSSDLLRATGRLTDAQDTCARALHLRELLGNHSQAKPARRLELARSYLAMGGLDKVLANYAAAEFSFRRALALCQVLANQKCQGVGDGEGCTEPACQQALAASHDGLGLLLADEGRFDEALVSFRQALPLYEKLVQDCPEAPAYRQELATSQFHMGWMLANSQLPAEAEKAYWKTLHLRNKLVKDFPNVPVYRQELASIYVSMGWILLGRGKIKEAERSIHCGQALLAKLVENFGNVPEYRSELADSYYFLGGMLEKARRPNEAEGAYRQAVKRFRDLAHEFPNVIDYTCYLGISRYRLGVLLGDPRLLKEARANLETAAGRENDNQTARLGSDIRPRNTLAWFLVTCPQGGFHDPDLALKLMRDVVRRAPCVGPFWNTLGVVYHRLGNWQAEIEALEKSMQLRQGGDSYDWFFLAMAHWHLGDKQQSRKWFAQAVDWMEKHPQNDDDLRRFRAEAALLLGVEDQPAVYLQTGPAGLENQVEI